MKHCIPQCSKSDYKIKARGERSKVVMCCHEALSWIRGDKVRLNRVPGHSNVKGNIEVFRLVKLGVMQDSAEGKDLI